MNKILSVILVLAFVLGMVVTPVSAAVPTKYESSIAVRNLSASAGEITLVFYDLTGTPVGTPTTDPIAANETKSYYQSSMPVAAGFNGSVVVSSVLPIAAMSNLVGLNATSKAISYAAYGAFSVGSATVSLPTLFKNNYGYNTFYYVQNTGGVNTNVAIAYSDGTTSSITDLKPGMSAVIKQADEAHTPMVFSGTLTASASDIAVTVVEEGNTLFAYDGFAGGATNPIMPLINQNNYGYFTGVQIQNSGASDTVVTVAYTPASAGTACTERRTVKAGASDTFSQFVFFGSRTETDPQFATTCVMGQTFVGSAEVTVNSASMPLVAVVNQLQIAQNKGGAYGAFNPASGLQKIIYPLIMDRNYGYFTSWSIVNVGTDPIAAGALVCNVTGTATSGAININIPNADIIPAKGSWTLNHNGLIGAGFVGGATCTGPTGAKLIGTSNQLGTGTLWDGLDTLLVSEGFVVAP